MSLEVAFSMVSLEGPPGQGGYSNPGLGLGPHLGLGIPLGEVAVDGTDR